MTFHMYKLYDPELPPYSQGPFSQWSKLYFAVYCKEIARKRQMVTLYGA